MLPLLGKLVAASVAGSTDLRASTQDFHQKVSSIGFAYPIGSLLCGIFLPKYIYNDTILNWCLWDQCRKICHTWTLWYHGYVILHLDFKAMLESTQQQLRRQDSGICFHGDVFVSLQGYGSIDSVHGAILNASPIHRSEMDEKPTGCSWTPNVTCSNCFFLSQKFYSFMQHLFVSPFNTWATLQVPTECPTGLTRPIPRFSLYVYIYIVYLPTISLSFMVNV